MANLALKRRLRRQQSLGQHVDHFDAIIRGSMDNLMDTFSDIGGKIIREYGRDLAEHQDLALEILATNFAHNIQRKIDRFVHVTVEDVWPQLDSRKDGALELAEMRSVIRGLFNNLELSLPELVKDAFQPALDDLVHYIQSGNMGSAGFGRGTGANHIVMEEISKSQIEFASNKLLALLGLLVKGLIASSDAISDELFSEIDVNKDNKVTKAEFSEGFAEAIGPVLDFSRISKLLLEQRAKRAARATRGKLMRSSSFEASSMDLPTVLLGCGFVVLLGGLAYSTFQKMRHHGH